MIPRDDNINQTPMLLSSNNSSSSRRQRLRLRKHQFSMPHLTLSRDLGSLHICNNHLRLLRLRQEQEVNHSKCMALLKARSTALDHQCRRTLCTMHKACSRKTHSDNNKRNSMLRTPQSWCTVCLSHRRSNHRNPHTSRCLNIGKDQALPPRHSRPNTAFHKTLNTTLQVSLGRLARQLPSLRDSRCRLNISRLGTHNLDLQFRNLIPVP